MNDMNKLMKQAQKLQKSMEEAQKQIIALEITGEAGGGLVKVTMRGDHRVIAVFIDPSLLKVEEQSILQDLVAAAVNKAVEQIVKTTETRMRSLTANLGLPTDLGGTGTQE